MSRVAAPGPRPTAAAVMAALDALGDPDRALSSASFFKSGPGEYGEGDHFIGVTVPQQRRVAKEFRGLDRAGVRTLLDSDVHEHRLTGLFLLRSGFEKAATGQDRQAWVDLYLQAVFDGCVDNWDLVDSSAEYVLGAFLLGGDHRPLLDLADHDDLWVRRVAIIATAAFTKSGDPVPILEVAPRVLPDRRDLIQKAVGWMLREMGKRIDRGLLLTFLDEHAAEMGRTALSYATEHLDPGQRAHYRALR